MPHSIQIAIDGPVAAGKGTVSRLVAERLGFLYVDTGAMYRCAAFLAVSHGILLSDEAAIVAELRKHKIDLRIPSENERDGRLITVLLDGEDVSWKIRTEEISSKTPLVSQHPKVREELVRQQQAIAATQNVVMEGRDITHTVLPNAQLKIFLTADPQERAGRRHQELLSRGQDVSLEEVLRELQERDRRDSEKNLKIVPDAWVLDTTGKTIEEVVDIIETKVRTL